jgi:hypothetical protein
MLHADLILTCESREADLAAPRMCSLLGQFSAGGRDDYWCAEVSPPFIGQHFGLGGDDLAQVILATKWQGQSLLDAEHGSVAVYVARATKSSEPLRPEDIQVLLRGILERSPI